MTELPFSQLSWTEFEELVAALARDADDLIDVRRYGESQRQHGVDVIGFTRADRRAYAYQCKRVDKFTEADLSRAIAEFADGARPFSPVRFVVAVAKPARRTQVLGTLLAERAIHPDLDLRLWDAPELNDLLRERPRIVERFFGKDTARAFCLSDSYSPSASPDDVCPYPGLAPFEPGQARWFFGRRAVLAEICERLDGLQRAAGPLIMVAPSGAGKSSLLRAGVVPALGEGRLAVSWPCVLMTPTSRPMNALAQQMSAATGGGPAGRAVLLVDQFEEVFTLCADENERAAFIGELTRLADHPASSAGPSALVMVCLRADFYGQCLRYAGLRAALRSCTLPLGPMSDGELREAIVCPAEAAGLQVEPGLPELLLRDAGLAGTAEDQAARLPLVAHALRATWQQRQGRFLTVDGYRMTGGIGKAVATTAEREYSLLGPAGQQLAEAMFLRLVKVGDGTADVCRPASRDEFLRDLPGDAGAAGIMDRFTRARLLNQERDMVTIAHEALLSSWPRLSGWIADGRDDHLMRQQLDDMAAVWDRDHDVSGLLRGKRLRDALAWAREHQADLGAAAKCFLAASSRRRRRARAVVLAAGAVAVVLAVAVAATSAVAIGEHQADVRKARQAAYNQATSEARRTAARNPQLAAQLDLAAYRIQPSASAANRLIATENTPLYSRLPVSASVVAFSPGRDIFATGGESIRLWEMTGAARARPLGQRFGVLPARSMGGIRAMAFDHDSSMLAVIGNDTIWLWGVSDPARPRLLGVIAHHGSGLGAVAFSPGSDLLAAGGGIGPHGDVTLWDVSDPAHPRELGRPLATSHGFAASVAFSPDGRTLAIGDGSGNVRLWDVARPASPRPISLLVGTGASAVSSLAFSPGGAILAAGTLADGIQLWNVTRPTRPHSLSPALAGCSGSWGSAAFDPDGLLVAGCGDGSGFGGSVRLWNMAAPSGPALASLPQAVTTPVNSLTVSPDDRTLVSAGMSGRVLVWSIPPVMFNDGQVSAMAYSQPRRILASAGLGGYIQLWKIGGRAGPQPFGPPLGARGIPPLGARGIPTALAFSPDGRLLAIGYTGSVRLRLLADMRRSIVVRIGPKVTVSSLALSPHGNILAVGSEAGSVELWNLTDPARPRELSKVPGGFSGGPVVVAFSPSGDILAVGNLANRVRLWLLSDPRRPRHVGQPLQAAASTIGGVSSLAFSPNGHVLVSGTEDGTVQAWNVADPAHSRALGQPLRDAAGSFVSVAFATDGTMLAIAGLKDSVQLWDMANPASLRPTGQLITISADPALAVSALAGTPAPLVLAGATVITGTTGGAAWLWDVKVSDAIKRICAIPAGELTPAQWHRYIPHLPYTTTCPQ